MTLVRYEVMPFGDAAEQVERLGAPAHLTVTCSPRHGLDATIAFAEAAAAHGHVVAPHIAARRVRSRAHLHEVLARLDAAGIDQGLVIGGDGNMQEGPYGSALDLLRAMQAAPRPLRATVGAYPEGHPLVSGEALFEALRAKQTYAASMTTQMCFSARTLTAWLVEARAQDIDLPAIIGVPGRVDRQKLLTISLQIGVGASKRYLRKQPKAIARLLTGGAAPQDAARHAALACAQRGELGIAGIHVFTFNRLGESMLALQAPQVTAAHERITSA